MCHLTSSCYTNMADLNGEVLGCIEVKRVRTQSRIPTQEILVQGEVLVLGPVTYTYSFTMRRDSTKRRERLEYGSHWEVGKRPSRWKSSKMCWQNIINHSLDNKNEERALPILHMRANTVDIPAKPIAIKDSVRAAQKQSGRTPRTRFMEDKIM